MSLLQIQDVAVYYGGIQALKGVTLHLEPGELLAIVGANGAGKTTLLRTVSGVLRARSGSIRFDGNELTRLPTHAIVGLGIAHSPEGRQLFGGLTVLENLRLGAVQRSDRAAIEHDLDYVFELFPILRERRRQLGGTLSGGEQQMLTIARTLMGNPKILLLDEPSEGLAPLVVETLRVQLARLKQSGLTMVLTEQNVRFVSELGDRVYILEKGMVRWHSSMTEFLADEDVRRAYLAV
jgi:branched-chain amino acid transport system ATP-binding protein